MAPVSNSVVGIDDDQRFALMKFRRSVKDILKPEHNDHFLLRWLRARQWDAEAAEKMLRDSMSWREKWEVDTTLHTWKPPEVLEKHFPSGSTGFDKEGSPVIIVPFVGLDVWGLLHSLTRTDVIRMILLHLENYLATARKQASVHGPAALKVTVIFDMEGFNMRQYAWKPAAEMVVTLLKIYEANYPEILKTCFIVNAPKVFSLAFSIVKKFMHEYTISKIKIYGSDSKKWQAQILAIVDKDQLPVFYGGTMVDDNGDPKCSLIVKPGGKVPKSYYTKNTSSESKEYKRVTIKTGDKYVVDLLCAEPNSILKVWLMGCHGMENLVSCGHSVFDKLANTLYTKADFNNPYPQWDFGVDSHEIKFSIKRRCEEGADEVVHGPRKVHEGAPDIGFIPAAGPATYSIIFDNSSAFLRSKKVYYDVLIVVPEKVLNTSDLPEDVAASSATAL